MQEIVKLKENIQKILKNFQENWKKENYKKIEKILKKWNNFLDNSFLGNPKTLKKFRESLRNSKHSDTIRKISSKVKRFPKINHKYYKK